MVRHKKTLRNIQRKRRNLSIYVHHCRGNKRAFKFFSPNKTFEPDGIPA